jgi:hypothetical protein
MRVIKATYPDGSPLYSAFPTSTKEVFRLFSVYGINAMLVKYGGKYDICFPNSRENGGPRFIQTNARCVDAFTCKYWLELASSNCPEANRMEKGLLWLEMTGYVNKETLMS